MSTNIKNLLDIELPIIQAPMAGVQDSAVALAVSSVGGLGSLPCAMLSAEQLESELTAINADLDYSNKGRPINFNFFCHNSPIPNTERESRWREILSPYFDEYGVKPQDIPVGARRAPFSHQIADVIEPYRPRVISFHFGLPTEDLLGRVQTWGASIMASATTLKEALWLETQGVDCIIAQGLEAGGHRGMFLSGDLKDQMGSLALTAQLLKEVEVPVIAAGGIADAKGVSAALAMGASAVQVGTAYLLCSEMNTSEIHRAAIKSADAKDTAITNIFSGRPARGIVNRAIRELGPINTAAPEFPLAATAITAIRQQAERRGSNDFTPLWCGQNSSGCKEISASELTQELAANL